MILISPYAKTLRNGRTKHPKNYPWWPEVIQELSKSYELMQIGISGEPILLDNYKFDLSLTQLRHYILNCETWIGVDSFFQHYCWELNKPGVAIFAQSDPNIFGHKENVNLLKSRSFLRKNQFHIWEQCEYLEEAFVEPPVVVQAVIDLRNKLCSNLSEVES